MGQDKVGGGVEGIINATYLVMIQCTPVLYDLRRIVLSTLGDGFGGSAILI